MLFNSPEFIFLFVPLAVALHFSLARFGVGAAATATLLTSLVFYAWWNPPFVILPLVSIAVNFGLAQAMLRQPHYARAVLAAGIIGNLAVLAWFKYASFVASLFTGVAAVAPPVPLALSFTTFVQIAFLVSIYQTREQAIRPRIYALFVVFFPHLIAGPLVRWNDLAWQLADRARYRADWNNIALGITIFVFGLAKKVLIADKLAPHVAPVFDTAAQGAAVTALAAWGGALAYGAQLYFDFSGYSDMAVGLGLLFNFRLPLNFAAPLRATSMIEFWRRWHITLSRFLRDFLYIPLGGARRGAPRTAANLVVTMTLGGLWHGANWTFMAWGLFNGMLLAINHAWRRLRGARPPTSSVLAAGWAATFLAYIVGMVFFRAADMGAAATILKAMAGFAGPDPAAMLVLNADERLVRLGYVSQETLLAWFGATWTVRATGVMLAALAVAFLLPDTMEITGYAEGEGGLSWRRRWVPRWRVSWPWFGIVLALAVACFLQVGKVSEFLYYQF